MEEGALPAEDNESRDQKRRPSGTPGSRAGRETEASSLRGGERSDHGDARSGCDAEKPRARHTGRRSSRKGPGDMELQAKRGTADSECAGSFPSPRRESSRRRRRRSRSDQGECASSSRRISYGKESTEETRKRRTSREESSPRPPSSRHGELKRAKTEHARVERRELHQPGHRGRSRADSRSQRPSRRLRPSVDLSPGERRDRDSRIEEEIRGGVRLVEAEDWVGHVLGAMGTSDDEVVAQHHHHQGQDADFEPEPLPELQARARAVLSKGCSYGSVGGHLTELMLTLESPMGDFMRRYCSTQPPPAVRPYSERRGDVLPIHPGAVTTALEGVNSRNVHCVKATVMVLNYLYCRGRLKPTGVPIADTLCENQKEAIFNLGRKLSGVMDEAGKVPTPASAVAKLEEVDGNELAGPVSTLEDLDAERMIAAWPPADDPPVPVVSLLDSKLMGAVRDPTGWWLPDDLQPQKRTRCDVKASDAAWYRLCRAAHQRGLMRVVRDEQLHKDREGHFITIGAGGISTSSEPSDEHGQRFIPIMEAVNEHSDRFPEERDAVRFGGFFETTILKHEGTVVVHPGQLTGVLSQFSVPDSWLPHFAFSKKVCASAFGGTKQQLVRPAWCRLPGAWQNSLVLVEVALCELVFTRCGVPRSVPELQQEDPLRSRQPLIDCFGSLDELRRLREFGIRLEESSPSQHYRRFEAICGSLKLPLRRAKELICSLMRGLTGMSLDEESGRVTVAVGERESFITLSLGMLQSPLWKVAHLRRWLGKALFIATFHRRLLSLLEAVVARLIGGTHQDFAPNTQEVDEAESPQKVKVSHEISRTTATPMGGSCASATTFVDRSLEVPEAISPRNECVACGQQLEAPELERFPCPRACGEVGCSVRCAQSHFEMGNCSRRSFAVPRFGERFAGPNYPLTRAVALAGGAVQRPLGLDIEDNAWDFFTEQGKEALEYLEEDPALRWRHWAPDSFTFKKQPEHPVPKGKGKQRKSVKFRSKESPWGLDRVSRDDHVKMRQENKNGKEEPQRGRGCGPPRRSSSPFCPSAAMAAVNRWTAILHNSPRVHQALHCPRCRCNSSRGRESSADVSGNAEYPWNLCVAFARAIVADQRALMIPPLGTAQFDLPHLLYNQIMGAARGLQSEDLVYALVMQVEDMVRHMDAGDEQRHLSQYVMRQWLKGTVARLAKPKELVNGRGVIPPYPAFRWFWHTRMSHTWPERHPLEVLQMIGVLAELRRRSQSCHYFHQVYINVTDFVLSCWYPIKGPTRSRSVNLVLQKMLSLELAANMQPVLAWTLPKWNE
eukprot:s3307_g14.t1